MATVKLFLDTRRPLKNNTYPIKLRVWHRSAILLSTSFNATPNEWTGTQYKETAAICKARNVHLRTMLNKIETLLIYLEQSGSLYNITDRALRSLCLQELGRRGQSAVTLIEYLKKASDGRAESTKAIYRWIIALVESYDGKVQIADVDEVWLCRFCDQLNKKYKPNTVAQDKAQDKKYKPNTVAQVISKILRAINIAVEDGVIATNSAKNVKRPCAVTRKKSLSVEAVRRLRDMVFPPEQRRAEYARDIWLLQLYLIGINVADLYDLGEIVDGRVEYDRHKTGTLYSIKILPEAMRIIDKYRGSKRLLAPPGPKHLVQMLNNALRGLTPNLTTNCARHTWATLAAEADIPIETISHALGHKIGSPITNIYVAYNQKKVDAANRKIIDYINADIYEKS